MNVSHIPIMVKMYFTFMLWTDLVQQRSYGSSYQKDLPVILSHIRHVHCIDYGDGVRWD